jgi:hypothetical protein
MAIDPAHVAPLPPPVVDPEDATGGWVVIPRRVVQWVLNDLAQHEDDYHHVTPPGLTETLRKALAASEVRAQETIARSQGRVLVVGPPLQTRPANAPGASPGVPSADPACTCHRHRKGCPMLPGGDGVECTCGAPQDCKVHGLAAQAAEESRETSPQEEFDRLVEFWLAAYGEVQRFLAKYRDTAPPDDVAGWGLKVSGEVLLQAGMQASPVLVGFPGVMDDAELEFLSRRASRNAKGALVIHAAPCAGLARCDLPGPVEDWPPGHFYDEDHHMVNCQGCKAALDPVGAVKDEEPFTLPGQE